MACHQAFMDVPVFWETQLYLVIPEEGVDLHPYLLRHCFRPSYFDLVSQFLRPSTSCLWKGSHRNQRTIRDSSLENSCYPGNMKWFCCEHYTSFTTIPRYHMTTSPRANTENCIIDLTVFLSSLSSGMSSEAERYMKPPPATARR